MNFVMTACHFVIPNVNISICALQIPRQFKSSGPPHSTLVMLHFASLSTFSSTRRALGLPLFPSVKLNLFLTSEVGEDIIMTDLFIFRNIKNLMFVSLAGFFI